MSNKEISNILLNLLKSPLINYHRYVGTGYLYINNCIDGVIKADQ